MNHRPLRRAIAMSLLALLALAGTASADRLFADGDLVSPTTPQGTKPLGDVAPGAEVSADIGFVLTCVGVAHVDDGQSVVLSANGGTQPADGEIISVSTAVLDPVPSEWADDGVGCPDPVPSLPGGAFSRVTLRAPTVPGPYTFTVAWARSFQPAGNGDSLALGPSMTSINLTMNVVGNIAPRLVLPANFSVEGNTTNGWTADWSGVIATDPEDAPDPVPTCTPASGSTLPLGTNHVSCSVTDRGGLTTTGGFDVTVNDTAEPVLHDVPADFEVITSDPTGTTLDYATPTATDIVDPSPDVTCTPATGERVGTGTTTVTCTAVDGRDKSISDSFDVTVTYRAPHTATATWQDPIDVSGNTFSASHGRTLPIKVRLFVDGAEVRTARVPHRHAVRRRDRSRPAADHRRRPLERLARYVAAGRFLSCGRGQGAGNRGRKLPARAARRRAGQGQQNAGAGVDERRDAGVHE